MLCSSALLHEVNPREEPHSVQPTLTQRLGSRQGARRLLLQRFEPKWLMMDPKALICYGTSCTWRISFQKSQTSGTKRVR